MCIELHSSPPRLSSFSPQASSTFRSLAFNFLLFVLLRVIWSSFPIAFNCLLRSFFLSFLFFLLSFTFSLLVNDFFAFDCLSSSCSSCWGLCVCDRGYILSCPVLEQAASSMMFSDQHLWHITLCKVFPPFKQISLMKYICLETKSSN